MDQTGTDRGPRRPQPGRRRRLSLVAAFLLVATTVPSAGAGAPGLPPGCAVPAGFLSFSHALPASAAALAAGRSLDILIVGSSLGGLERKGNRGSRLRAALEDLMPGAKVSVASGDPGALPAGVQFERLRADFEEKVPSLVIWQVGLSEAVSGTDLDSFSDDLRRGAEWVTEHGADLILMDPPFVPGVDTEQSYWPIVARIRQSADAAAIPIFPRYAVTQHLAAKLPDGPGRGCVPGLLAEAIAATLAGGRSQSAE